MPAPSKSKWFETFAASVREPMTRSNLDEYSGVGALHLLEGDERTEAEDLLFERLRHDDGRAAAALADIGSQRAVQPLRDRLGPAVPAMMRVAAARALHRLGDDGGRDAAIDVLRSGDHYEQMWAIGALAQLGGAESERALERALDAADDGVRSAAAGALIRAHGLQDFNRTYRDRLGLLQNRLSSSLATVRAAALGELQDIFVRHAGGESPEQLGLTWVADDEHAPLQTFVESLQREPPWQDDFALDVVEALPERERRWAEDCLWHFLPGDPRAARAFARLGVTRAIEPLREAAKAATGEVAIEVDAALWKLDHDADARKRLEVASRQADAALAARARGALA